MEILGENSFRSDGLSGSFFRTSFDLCIVVFCFSYLISAFPISLSNEGTSLFYFFLKKIFLNLQLPEKLQYYYKEFLNALHPDFPNVNILVHLLHFFLSLNMYSEIFENKLQA